MEDDQKILKTTTKIWNRRQPKTMEDDQTKLNGRRRIKSSIEDKTKLKIKDEKKIKKWNRTKI